MSGLTGWLDRHTADAPPVLRARVQAHALRQPSSDSRSAPLAQAGRDTLELVVAHPGDRSVALDLLAADALITLALLAQAQEAPERLGAFATSILQAVRPAT